MDNAPEAVVLVPAAAQPAAGQPLVLEVDSTGSLHLPSSIPLCMVTNFRSIYNKIGNFRRFLKEVAPDCTIASETWDYEGRRLTLEAMLMGTHYKVLAFRRKGGRRGGSCAIIYNEVKFKVEELNVDKEEEIESVWAILTPKNLDHQLQTVKRICVGSVYIAPRSARKQETMDHIIQTIHLIRSRFNNEVNFIIGGDVNRTNYEDVLDSYGALKQCVTVSTRRGATLTMILSDLHTYYHPPTTLAPLQVDEDKAGKDSDHDVIIFAPKSDTNFKVERKKKVIKARPLPDSKIPAFGREFQEISWKEVFQESDLDSKVFNFHKIIVNISYKHFPEKVMKISNLDKKWMTPYLKNLSRKIKSEFYRKRKSKKWRQMKKEFKVKKKKAVRDFNTKFVQELKQTDPSKFYQMCKKIGLGDQMNSGDLKVECLKGLSDLESAEAVALGFAAVSNQYEPLDRSKLPAYLPSLPPPQVEEYQVFEKLKKLKNTKSTLPIDMPNKLRNEVAVELAKPLTHIINECLSQGRFPALWKHEWISPVPKIPEPLVLKNLRKVVCTSDYNKVLEGFTKDWLL